MKCRQCSNPIRVKFEGGFCSRTCMEYKPRRTNRLKAIVEDDKIVFVDASNEDVIPNYPNGVSASRSELIREFKEAIND